MKLSVIIPTYNCGRHLIKAVESSMVDKIEAMEILIVDDGSTDSTKDEVAKIQRQYPGVRYLYQDNSGPGAARNRGLKEAKGEFVAFLDADDELLPGSLRERISFLDQYKDVEMVFTDYFVLRKSSDTMDKLSRLKGIDLLPSLESVKEKDWYIAKRELYKFYLSFSPNPIWTCTVMIRRSVVERVGNFRTDIFISEDRDYWMRILKDAKVGYIDRPLAVYKNFQSQLTKLKERSYRDIIKSLEDLKKDALIPRHVLGAELAEIYYNLGHYLMDERRWMASKGCFMKSLFHNPSKPKYWLCLFAVSKGMVAYFRNLKSRNEVRMGTS